jgi:hypothetical protein
MNYKQRKLLFIGVVTFLQVLFLFALKQDVEQGERLVTHNLFPLSDAQCTWQEYFYYTFEHFFVIYIFLFMYWEIKSIRVQLWHFVVLYVIDYLDFVLTYNSVWMTVKGFPVSFNVIEVGVVCWIIYNAQDD